MAERPFDFTVRLAEERDREGSIELYRLSQRVTGIPDPRFVPENLLEQRLYDGLVLKRYVAEHAGKLIGHALVELPNPPHIPQWIGDTKLRPQGILELGRAFVHPDYFGQGVWTELLRRRLSFVEEEVGRTAVAATWIQNDHVKQTFERFGAVHVGDKPVADGEISLYRFDRHSRPESVGESECETVAR